MAKSIQFSCSHCGVPIRADESQSGQKSPCPKCGSMIVVPATSRPSAPPPPAAEPDPFEGLEEFVEAQQSAMRATGRRAGKTVSDRMVLRFELTTPQFEMPFKAKIKHMFGWAVSFALFGFVLLVVFYLLWIVLVFMGLVVLSPFALWGSSEFSP